MTDLEREFYNQYFTRYGAPCDESNHTMYLVHFSMNHMKKPEDIVRADKSAAADIRKLEEYIKFLKLYRQELADTYNHLVTDSYTEVVKLERRIDYYNRNKVYFYLRFFRRYNDSGKEAEFSCKRFDGIQRNDAIKEYKTYLSEHPDAIGEANFEFSYFRKNAGKSF